MANINNKIPDVLVRDGDANFWENAVRLQEKRLGILASNIANADTPNYKARDIDFKAALQEAIARVVATEPVAPINGQQIATSYEPPLLFRIPMQTALDGNTVNVAAESAEFAQTAIRYEFSMRKAVEEYRHLAEMFKNLT